MTTVAIVCAVVLLAGAAALIAFALWDRHLEHKAETEDEPTTALRSETPTPAPWPDWPPIGRTHRPTPIPRPLQFTSPPIRDWQAQVCTSVRHEQRAQRWLDQIRAGVAA